MIARFKRMGGKNVFYPLGWDDNGLPTERRVQNYYNVWCSEDEPYDHEFNADDLKSQPKSAPPRSVSRKNFFQLCRQLSQMDEGLFRDLFTRIGLSIDWRFEYRTIDTQSQRASQVSFLRLLREKHLYLANAPCLWDIDFQTAIAQAEVEDRAVEMIYHLIEFGAILRTQSSFSKQTSETAKFTIATTRPELLASCVAIAAHPEDNRYQHLFGHHAITPVFFAPVPILPWPMVERDKGTGIMMVCTFGDMLDVEFWRQEKLPLRLTIGKNGRLSSSVKFVPLSLDTSDVLNSISKLSNDQIPLSTYRVQMENNDIPSLLPELANENYAKICNKSSRQARNILVKECLINVHSDAAMAIGYWDVFGKVTSESNQDELMSSSSFCPPLISISSPEKSYVKFFEKGSSPLEILATKQWFLRLLDKKAVLLEAGAKIQWHPSLMVHKYNDWIQGLNSDWCISRQRFYGVPIPIYYRLDDDGKVRFDQLLIPDENELPIDPMFDLPKTFSEADRNKPGGFIHEVDVFDTWWTSSLTPQIVTQWIPDGLTKPLNAKSDSRINDYRSGQFTPLPTDFHHRNFPMSLRPQSHEIIRTWTFYTICKSLLHSNCIPWTQIAISGWVIDQSGKKISKSKATSSYQKLHDPMNLLDGHFADSIRYWAGYTRIGADTTLEEAQLSVGKRLVTKIFNAAKLVLTYSPSPFLSIQSTHIDLDLVDNLITHKPTLSSLSSNQKLATITNSLDLALISQLQLLVIQCNEWFEANLFSKVLRETEIFFRSRFTDAYLEMVKARARDPIAFQDRDSAIITMRVTMNCILRLIAPILPYITEEVWSWTFAKTTDYTSIHLAPYPTPIEISNLLSSSPTSNPDISNSKYYPIMDSVIICLDALRKAKTEANLKFSNPIDKISVRMNSQHKAQLESIWPDLLFAVRGKNIKVIEDDSLEKYTFKINLE